MAIRIELRVRGTVIDGAEEWWDDVENALEASEHTLPILESISPYGELTVPHDRLLDLANECRLLQPMGTPRIQSLLQKVWELCEMAFVTPDAELRFEGD